MGRIYKSCKEMISEEFRNLRELGVELQSSTMQDKDVRDNDDYKTLEIQGADFTITNPSDKEEMYTFMKEQYGIDLPLKWAKEEFKERISKGSVNPGEAYKLRQFVWEEFLHNGKFGYSYNERLLPNIDKIIVQLKKNKTTRQAILSIFNSELDIDSMGGMVRVPCSMFYQFLIRPTNGVDKLNAIYVMRSSDLLTHFVNDVYLALRMQEHIAKEVGVEVGTFTMFISSFHAYYKDLKAFGIF